MTKYQTLHKRKTIKRLSSKKKFDFSEAGLLMKAKQLYTEMIKKKVVKETAKNIGYITCRVDLTGSPEVSFTIAVEKGKVKLVPGKTDNADMAIGMGKEFFIDLVNDPPKYGNMKIALFNNIILRKGRVKLFRYLKPFMVNALLSK